MNKRRKETEGSSKLNRISKTVNFILNILFIILSLICILPVVFVFMISISSEASIAHYGYQLIPRELSPDSYIFLWGERFVLIKALFVSVLVTVLGTALGIILTTSMGYVLSRKNYKLNNLASWLVFVPMVFNGGLIATYVINTSLLGFKNVIWALVLPLAVSSFNVIICRTFFVSTIPDSLIESAKIDGATQLKIFIRIVLPISKPLIATIGIFLCFNYWNDWFQSALYITDKNLFSMQALLNNIQKSIEYLANNPSAGLSLQQYVNTIPQEGVRMAMAIIILLPIACAYPFFQKYFVSGLTVGAIKG